MEPDHIRTATENDAHGIAIVHVKTWQYAYRGQIPDDYLRSLSIEERDRLWRDILSAPNPRTQVLVAESGESGKVTGFCSVGPSWEEDATEATGKVYAIYVDPHQMNRGIGSRLLSAALGYLKQQDFAEVTLWVLVSNEKARRFYERHGFTPDGKTKTEPGPNFEFHEIRYRSALNQNRALVV